MNYPSVTRHFILLMSFLLLIFTACDAFCYLRTSVHLKITNQLGSGLDLTIHCKSKDEDLGAHVVHFDGDYTMEFCSNAWGTTQYFCGMTWSGKLHWFDIFVARRDSFRCGKCTWRILPRGPCMTYTIGESKEYKCYHWNGEVL
ncbi:hypothetical protein OIU74_025499 [Salix koriyanagi]|uniref:S-protein homolog n=1 Tax=Salix koriyanagi TaxID=2511006 RepID=A0A9Q1A5M7_9ROSI|nr:hypothetical protein OIU74_025499 [Salix koriyanagi]